MDQPYIHTYIHTHTHREVQNYVNVTRDMEEAIMHKDQLVHESAKREEQTLIDLEESVSGLVLCVCMHVYVCVRVCVCVCVCVKEGQCLCVCVFV